MLASTPNSYYCLTAGIEPAVTESPTQPLDKDEAMKIKTNLRAGKSINNTVVSYVKNLSRCVGV